MRVGPIVTCRFDGAAGDGRYPPRAQRRTTMSTPATTIAGGFFAQLMPMLADRTVMMIVSKAGDQHLTISVIPKRTKDSENAALLTPFCCTGTPEELDRELPRSEIGRASCRERR